MQIRPAGAADQEGWLGLRSALWPGETPVTHRAEMEAMLALPQRWIAFVAESSEGELVGLVEVSLREDVDSIGRGPIAHVEGWVVAPSHRGRGIGRQLMLAGEQWALARGCHAITSDTELDNEASHRAHLALGFREVGREIRFRRPLD